MFARKSVFSLHPFLTAAESRTPESVVKVKEHVVGHVPHGDRRPVIALSQSLVEATLFNFEATGSRHPLFECRRQATWGRRPLKAVQDLNKGNLQHNHVGRSETVGKVR